MARFIKIRKQDISDVVDPIRDNDCDILIGKSNFVQQGKHNANSINDFTLFIKNGKYFTFEVIGRADVWTKAVQKALMDTSNVPVVTVLPIFPKGATPVKISKITKG